MPLKLPVTDSLPARPGARQNQTKALRDTVPRAPTASRTLNHSRKYTNWSSGSTWSWSVWWPWPWPCTAGSPLTCHSFHLAHFVLFGVPEPIHFSICWMARPSIGHMGAGCLPIWPRCRFGFSSNKSSARAGSHRFADYCSCKLHL